MKRSTLLPIIACFTLASPTLDGPSPPPVAARVEVIELHSCAPGWTDLGGTCWPNALTEPGVSASETADTPGEFDGEPFGSGPRGGSGKKPPKPPRQRFVPTEGSQCHADALIPPDDKLLVITRGTYTRGAGSTWYCCEAQSCITCNPVNHPDGRCLNGWPLEE